MSSALNDEGDGSGSGSGSEASDEILGGAKGLSDEVGGGREPESSFVRPPVSSASRSASRFMRNTFPNELAIVLLLSPIFP